MCFFLGAAAAGAAGAAGSMAGIGTAISAITSLATIPLSIMQAQAQQDAQMEAYRREVEHRNKQFEESQKTLNQQVAQQQAALNSERDKAQGEKARAAMDAYAAESRATASAAESGVVGLSVEHMVGSIRGELGRFNSTIDYNAKVAEHNTVNELKMAQRGQQARVNSIPIPVKPKFNMGLEIGSAVLSGLGGFAKAIA